MKCNKCGFENNAESKYCINCGSGLITNNQFAQDDKMLEINKQKKSCTIMGIIGLVLSFFINILSLPINVIAIVKGSKIKKQTGKIETGIILGIIGIVIGTIIFCIVLFYTYVAIKLFNNIKINKTNINNRAKMVTQVSDTINEVNKLEDNKIYKLDDLVSTGLISRKSKFGYDFIETSYVSKIGGEIEFCLIDEKHNGVAYLSAYDKETMEYVDNKDILKYTNLNKKCEFDISKVQAEKYLKQKMEEKYNQNFEIKKCENFGSKFYNESLGVTCEFTNGVKAKLYDDNFPEYEEIKN